jgi:peptide/nickel transport system substrate-binding protein
VPDGKPLSLLCQTTEAPLRRRVAEAIAANLRGCGLGVSVQYANPGDLFSPGPDGPVFGRKFDLVQFSWEASPRPNCLLYVSTQVPDGENRWVGANITGLTSAEFDASCAAAYWSRPIDGDFTERSRLVQERFASELPSLPLYFYPKIAISRPDLCGLEMDVTARSIFWNLEGLNYGEGCE